MAETKIKIRIPRRVVTGKGRVFQVNDYTLTEAEIKDAGLLPRHYKVLTDDKPAKKS